MMAHELLLKAAEILAAGWIKNCDAADDAGRIVPLWLGAVRADVLQLVDCTERLLCNDALRSQIVQDGPRGLAQARASGEAAGLANGPIGRKPGRLRVDLGPGVAGPQWNHASSIIRS